MNILIFSALYPPHVGGVERYVKNLSYALNDLGHNVTVVTSALNRDAGVAVDHEVEIFRLPCFSLMDGRLPIVRKDNVFRKMEKELEVHKFDFCMINTRFYTLSLFAAHFCHKWNVPSFVLDHGSAHLSFGNPILDFVENIYEHAITWGVKRYCHKFYGVSHDSEEFLKHFHINSKGVLHNAIDVADIEQIVTNTNYDVREKQGIPKNSVIVSYVGRLIHRKGILELNEAVSKLIEKYPELYLVYAGDGELSKELERNKSEHTILLGRLKYNDAIKLIAQSDIFCLPSETEGFPTSVLEAAACKTFIITTTAGGSKELITNRKYGIIMEDNLSTTIEKAIKEAMNPLYRKEAAENCYNEVKVNYSWEQIAKKVVQENEYE